MKKTFCFAVASLSVLIETLSSCTFNINSSLNDRSSDSSSENELSSFEETSFISSAEESSSDSSSEIEEKSSSKEESDEIETVEYEEVLNTIGPDEDKTYRIAPAKVNDDEFTVYNVKYNTKGYLAHPTTLTIKKTDYCLTFETVALYYQAFRQVPPNYVTDKNLSDEDLRYVSTYTYGSYSGSNSYTESLGEFNNSRGVYLELDIKLLSYSLKNRGKGRVVIVVDGIKDYGNEPVCYYTNDHYQNFWEFYNYASGWGPSFKGVGSKTSPRQIPETVTPIY